MIDFSRSSDNYIKTQLQGNKLKTTLPLFQVASILIALVLVNIVDASGRSDDDLGPHPFPVDLESSSGSYNPYYSDNGYGHGYYYRLPGYGNYVKQTVYHPSYKVINHGYGV